MAPHRSRGRLRPLAVALVALAASLTAATAAQDASAAGRTLSFHYVKVNRFIRFLVAEWHDVRVGQGRHLLQLERRHDVQQHPVGEEGPHIAGLVPAQLGDLDHPAGRPRALVRARPPRRAAWLVLCGYPGLLGAGSPWPIESAKRSGELHGRW
jgi:hypothetical protein